MAAGKDKGQKGGRNGVGGNLGGAICGACQNLGGAICGACQKDRVPPSPLANTIIGQTVLAPLVVFVSSAKLTKWDFGNNLSYI